MKRIVTYMAATILVLAGAAPAVAAEGPGDSWAHAPLYYVSLGDSLSVGEQPDAAGVGHPTNQSYPDQLLAIARQWYPNLELVKFGCSGETTKTVVEGGSGCEYNRGSQLADAVAFIKAHRQFVAFITIDIGANDFECQDRPECIPPGLAQIGTYLPRILTELRAAAGPSIPIVGGNIYDPILGAWFLGADGQALARQSVPLVAYVNAQVSGIYAAAGVPVADVQGAFHTSDWTEIAGPGGLPLPLNVATLCQLTYVCDPPPVGPNNHAKPAGYAVMAQAYAQVLEPLIEARLS